MITTESGTIRQRFFLFLFLIFISSTLRAEKKSETPAVNISPATKKSVGLILHDVSKEQDIVSINPDRPFQYASNLKMLTTITALEKLGGGFRFRTLFKYDPNSQILYIKAGGNPEMVVEDLWLLSKTLRSRGFSTVRKIIVDDYLYGGNPKKLIPGSFNGDRSYQAYISPLSLNYNSVRIVVSARPDMKRPRVIHPEKNGVFTVANRAIIGKKGHLITGTGLSNSQTKILLKGSMRPRRRPKVIYRKVFNPTRHYALTLLSFLQDTGTVPVERKKLNTELFSHGIVYRHESAPLRDILRKMNRYSSNFIAESITFFLGAKLAGSSDAGVDVLKSYARKMLNMPIDIINGSGLGNGKNRIPPAFFITLLRHAHNDPLLRIDFFATLPVLGEEGTLKNVEAYEYRGEFRGKTGTLTGVSAISGIMRTKKGTLLLLTFVVNNFPVRNFNRMWKYRDNVLKQIWRRY